MTNSVRLYLEDVVESFDRVRANRRAQSKNPSKEPRMQLWERRIYEGAKALLAPKPPKPPRVRAEQTEFPPEAMGDAAPTPAAPTPAEPAGQKTFKFEVAP